jgi:hypothetical protein
MFTTRGDHPFDFEPGTILYCLNGASSGFGQSMRRCNEETWSCHFPQYKQIGAAPEWEYAKPILRIQMSDQVNWVKKLTKGTVKEMISGVMLVMTRLLSPGSVDLVYIASKLIEVMVSI